MCGGRGTEAVGVIICVGNHSSNASRCNSPYSWISVGSHSRNASGCNSPYSWISVGSQPASCAQAANRQSPARRQDV